MIFLIAHFEWKDSVWHLTLRVPCDGLICHAGPFSHGSVLATSLCFPAPAPAAIGNIGLNICYFGTRLSIMIKSVPLENEHVFIP